MSINEQLSVLKGAFIQLEPLNSSHYDGLSQAANYEVIWEYMPQKGTAAFFAQWFADSVEKMMSGNQITYVARRLSDQLIVGATAYYDLYLEHKRLGLGYSWYTPMVWGSAINSDCKLLMLIQAFEHWGVNRIEIGADSRNARSIRAIKKLGARQEGILRQHMISNTGLLTDTILFSIVAEEWPVIKKQLNVLINNWDNSAELNKE